MFFSLQLPKPPCAPQPWPARLSVLWQHILGRGAGPVSQVCLSTAAAAAANCAQEGIGKKPLAPQWGGDRDGWGGSCVPEPSGEKDQSGTDGSAARQALHRHLVSITQYLAARKIIPHPNGHHRIWLQGVLCLLLIWLQGRPHSNGLSRRELQFPSVILHKACLQQH